jgi:hypothetical protein
MVPLGLLDRQDLLELLEILVYPERRYDKLFN